MWIVIIQHKIEVTNFLTLLVFLWAIQVHEDVDTLLWNPKKGSATCSQNLHLGMLQTYTAIVKDLDFPGRVTWVDATLRIALRDFDRHRHPPLPPLGTVHASCMCIN
jgi:hypothetical protein